MSLDLKDFDVLDWIETDEDLAALLNDALESGHGPYIDRTVANIERAKSLPADEVLTATQRLVRAAEVVGLQLTAVPRAA